jgi:uncharacterized membrane protein
MARRLTIRKYPLLKVTLPLAAVVAAVGLWLFLTHTCEAQDAAAGRCMAGENDYPTLLLVPWVIAAAALAFVGLLWRRKQTINVLLPSDTLAEASRQELQKLLDGLDEARAKGELTEERYQKARARVLQQMGPGKGGAGGKGGRQA